MVINWEAVASHDFLVKGEIMSKITMCLFIYYIFIILFYPAWDPWKKRIFKKEIKHILKIYSLNTISNNNWTKHIYN